MLLRCRIQFSPLLLIFNFARNRMRKSPIPYTFLATRILIGNRPDATALLSCRIVLCLPLSIGMTLSRACSARQRAQTARRIRERQSHVRSLVSYSLYCIDRAIVTTTSESHSPLSST